MYQTVLLPVVLYGCGTWSLILRGEHRLREIFGLRRDEITRKRLGDVHGYI